MLKNPIDLVYIFIKNFPRSIEEKKIIWEHWIGNNKGPELTSKFRVSIDGVSISLARMFWFSSRKGGWGLDAAVSLIEGKC